MNNNAKISVVIPVYNVEPYLKFCLNSIIEQTYKNLEIILVNDGSTDGSLNICKEYLHKDNRVKLINQENKGLSGARNSGIEIATGEYIAFVDSDDYVSSDYFEYLSSMLTQSVQIAVCKSKIVYNYTNDNIHIRANKFMKIKYYSIHDYCKLAFSDVRYMSAWGKLYHKSVFTVNRFPEGKLHEDIYIMADLFVCSDRIAVGNEEKYYYVKRKNSITTTKFNNRKFDLIESNNIFIKKVVKKYPDLNDYARVYQVHAASSLIKQIPLKDKMEYQTFIKDTVKEARKTIRLIINIKDIHLTEKILCFITSTNFYFIKVTWKLFEKVTGR